MTKILIATTNPGKKRELEFMFSNIDVELLTLAELDDGFEEVIEDGASFAENARKKAAGYASQSGLWTVADDSGLCVDYLDGAPGIHSARFSGIHKDHTNPRNLIDYQNIQKLLSLLEGVRSEKRTARFVCALALANPEQILFETTGIFEGRITDRLRGEGGFGYDPVFYVPVAGKTAAEMTKEEKNSMSHRHNAIVNLKPALERLISDQDERQK